MKTLIIAAHPNIEASIVNNRWIKELRKYPEKYTVHELYQEYPDEKIDIEKEQQRIESHGKLILQFPIQWFNCPPLLKKWLDDVFTYGWAYGSRGNQLKDRKVALAVTAGIRKAEYHQEGKYLYTLDQLLVPFETTFRYCEANYRFYFAHYGKEKRPGGNEEENYRLEAQELEQSARDYIAFIDQI
ncbi:Putative NADPH-quinone reductase (modulator of drug activity B) [Seinonella peptonophila]|uniref:Putative NADPH-quinone reductase (Modulator of drug activity B) n=1 Tax=Seinonella peptonophila TaxID=112248 RepID=A0A1M4ZEZ7_9BACL|nr:NAD(P)H-dependent oxidoreductase [Seinonella peptonophila]SHF16538.1 Putative NADPH-quinone reductase (modulator of drug activity B) [Seinonella peptonophila]